jgi:hypothetical protein
MSDDESVPSRIQASIKYCDNLDDQIVQKMIKDLCRLALFMEHKRSPMSKDDINKYVLKEHAKAFSYVYNQAQLKLKIFGLEMVQLMTKRNVKLSSFYITRSTLEYTERVEIQDPDLNVLLVVLALILGHGRSIPQGTLS